MTKAKKKNKEKKKNKNHTPWLGIHKAPNISTHKRHFEPVDKDQYT